MTDIMTVAVTVTVTVTVIETGMTPAEEMATMTEIAIDVTNLTEEELNLASETAIT